MGISRFHSHETLGKELKLSHLDALTCKGGMVNISTSWGCSNDESMCEKPLEQYLVHTELSMLPINTIIDLILCLQAGFLSFNGDCISNPNCQEKEYGLSRQSYVLRKDRLLGLSLALWEVTSQGVAQRGI